MPILFLRTQQVPINFKNIKNVHLKIIFNTYAIEIVKITKKQNTFHICMIFQISLHNVPKKYFDKTFITFI